MWPPFLPNPPPHKGHRTPAGSPTHPRWEEGHRMTGREGTLIPATALCYRRSPPSASGDRPGLRVLPVVRRRRVGISASRDQAFGWAT